MDASSTERTTQADEPAQLLLRALLPVAVAVVLAMLPAPDGLPQHAWYYFAIFAAVILGLVLEPLPGGAVGLIGVTVVAVLAQYELYSRAENAVEPCGYADGGPGMGPHALIRRPRRFLAVHHGGFPSVHECGLHTVTRSGKQLARSAQRK